MVVFIASSALEPSAFGYLVFIAETAVALALIALAAWAVRRYAGKMPPFRRQGARLRSIESLPLDARRSIHLVEVDGEPLLLGVSDHAVTLLKEVSKKEPGGDLGNDGKNGNAEKGKAP